MYSYGDPDPGPSGLLLLLAVVANSADEYVPIDHVVDGRSKRRVRLLNPYVLRLRRDAPLEAYKLKFVEVNTTLYYSLYLLHRLEINFLMIEQRQGNKIAEDLVSASLLSASPRFTLNMARRPSHVTFRPRNANRSVNSAPKTNPGNKISVRHAGRVKRQEKNVIIEEDDGVDWNKEITELSHDSHDSQLSKEFTLLLCCYCIAAMLLGVMTQLCDYYFVIFIFHDICKATDDIRKCDKNEIINTRKEMDSAFLNAIKTNWNYTPQPQRRYKDYDYVGNLEKEFALYKIEKPTLWFYVHVHLFEKLSTLKGNTLWNDITKGVPVSVSSMTPEWSSADMNVRYKPVDSVAREDFFLPKSSLSLLVPVLEENVNAISNNMDSLDDANYLLVPTEDVLNVHKTDKSSMTLTNVSSNGKKEVRRKVIVRVARALNNDMEDKLSVVSQASDKFLTTQHRGTLHAQVDLEARADDNQLVHESAPGRIAIIVADNTRGSRSTLTVQVTNTGLFVARFRAQIRDCNSGLMQLSAKQKEDLTSEAVCLPPRHTRRLQLRLPAFPPGENAELHQCTVVAIVYLLNEEGESVAVRDALIKKGDHCYCVWHCDCICYGDNPQLPCQEMSAARQDAAGLPARRGARFSRACHYADVITINISVVIIGVIGMLLFLGVLKGLLGLVWPRAGVWGLDWILEEPRHIDRYRERSLRARRVVYDTKGWPVHPDTRKRTVRVVSLYVSCSNYKITKIRFQRFGFMYPKHKKVNKNCDKKVHGNTLVQFILNVIFFMVTPGLVAVDVLKHLTKGKSCPASVAVGKNNANLPKCSQETLSRRQQSQVF
ncbi:uncharacterized protein LOC134660667 [Cydia amplana]|uniref:uncharacterized protein LOC134660667 n=1 Tax=Cydia amplana TaxID=1869771 RepID=UPI002FE6B5F3